MRAILFYLMAFINLFGLVSNFLVLKSYQFNIKEFSIVDSISIIVFIYLMISLICFALSAYYFVSRLARASKKIWNAVFILNLFETISIFVMIVSIYLLSNNSESKHVIEFFIGFIYMINLIFIFNNIKFIRISENNAE